MCPVDPSQCRLQQLARQCSFRGNCSGYQLKSHWSYQTLIALFTTDLLLFIQTNCVNLWLPCAGLVTTNAPFADFIWIKTNKMTAISQTKGEQQWTSKVGITSWCQWEGCLILPKSAVLDEYDLPWTGLVTMKAPFPDFIWMKINKMTAVAADYFILSADLPCSELQCTSFHVKKSNSLP